MVGNLAVDDVERRVSGTHPPVCCLVSKCLDVWRNDQMLELLLWSVEAVSELVVESSCVASQRIGLVHS